MVILFERVVIYRFDAIFLGTKIILVHRERLLCLFDQKLCLFFETRMNSWFWFPYFRVFLILLLKLNPILFAGFFHELRAISIAVWIVKVFAWTCPVHLIAHYIKTFFEHSCVALNTWIRIAVGHHLLNDLFYLQVSHLIVCILASFELHLFIISFIFLSLEQLFHSCFNKLFLLCFKRFTILGEVVEHQDRKHWLGKVVNRGEDIMRYTNLCTF